MISTLLRWRATSVLLLVAALAPYDGLLLIVPAPGVVGYWKEALVFGAACLAWYQRSPAEDARDAARRIPLWATAAALLAVLALVSASTVPVAQAVFGLKIGYFYLLVPLALWWTPMSRADRDRLVTILMVNGVITAAVGLAQQVAGPEALHAIGYEWNETIRYSGGFLRAFSTFNQPFPFGYFLAIVLLVGLPVALSDRQRTRNRVFLWASPFLVLALTSTVVRGAIVAIVVGGVVLAVRHRVLWRVTLLAAPLVVAVALFVDLSGFLSLDSLGERVTGWTAEVVERGVEPLGRGLGTTGSVAERYQADAPASTYPEAPLGERYQPDNHYVKMLVELGPLGLWLFAMLLGGAWRATTSAEREAVAAGNELDAEFAFGVRASFAGAMAAAMVSTYWEIFPADLYFWILLGAVSWNARPTSTPEATPARAGPSSRRRASPVSSSTPSRSAPAAAGSRPMAASWSASSVLGWAAG